jgi:alpha-acetolactate decarboxylase
MNVTLAGASFSTPRIALPASRATASFLWSGYHVHFYKDYKFFPGDVDVSCKSTENAIARGMRIDIQ